MSPESTQIYLPIAGIEEGVVILKDGSLAVVLKIIPINFDLKNELEQNAIIAKYQGFLNGLGFPVQIVIRSQRLDLEPYLVGLSRSTKDLPNELLQIHANDYIAFMRSLVSVANIMSKHYYLVLTYQGTVHAAKGSMLSLFKKQGVPTITRSTFNHYRDELNGRANTVASGLTAMGLQIEALDTQELIELFYGIYNPDISGTERLVEMDKLQGQVVSLEGSGEPASAAVEPKPVMSTESVIASDNSPAPLADQSASAEAVPTSDRIDLHPQTDITETVEIAEVPTEAVKKAAEDEPAQPTEPTNAPPTNA